MRTNELEEYRKKAHYTTSLEGGINVLLETKIRGRTKSLNSDAMSNITSEKRLCLPTNLILEREGET